MAKNERIKNAVGEWINTTNKQPNQHAPDPLTLDPIFYRLADEIFGPDDPALLSEDERQERLLTFFDRALTLAQQNIHANRKND
jgi:hypothetical protein